MNLERKFNVPTILSYSDSLGQHLLRENIRWATNCLIIDNRGFETYCHDTISLQIEVDPSFPEEDYDIEWKFNNRTLGTDKKVEITFEEADVNDFRPVIVKVKSKKNWHKLNDCDDCLAIQLTILPPE
ncbi:hypothetical protein GCM10007103_25830 [Salinimicrobium marinum]|uniref:Uncharacterized protein n=1 Tax=Salinimicrobium marinum TaxID=680283 RepID=A0A918SJS2_9FLAO|nr:hypothetical protein [Salinimicrobium marinum]GHA43517.1 hypothetical protein GCM10007103_25830 [Salinimicrobium marinum]